MHDNRQFIDVKDLILAGNQNGTTAAQEALKHGRPDMLQSTVIWPEPTTDDMDDSKYSDATLFNQALNSPLARYVESLSKSIQFPLNTAYLHGLGVISSAMNMNFRYDYYGAEKPTNLYIITAQPPSSGKSGINSALTEPVRKCYNEIATKNMIERRICMRKIKKLEDDIEKEKMEVAVANLSEELEKELQYLDSIPAWVYSVDDATPEALEKISSEQQGMFNVISDEADSINIILGKVYGEGKSNYGIFLKGWDGDYHSPARITRATKAGFVHGSICVIAQDESIDSILEAGLSGRGISERILMLREKNLFGGRDFESYIPIDKQAREDYEVTVRNILESDRTILTFCSDAVESIQGYRSMLEPELADGGKYSNAMLRGVVGKADKQIRKLSSVLHVCEEWAPNGRRSTIISADTVTRAILMFNNLVDTYITAADSQGFVGLSAELDKLIEVITKRAKKGDLKLTTRQLRDTVKNMQVFKQTSMLSSKFRDEYLPELEARGFCVTDKNTIYLNPRLK